LATCGGRSQAWWNNLVNYGAWRGPGNQRVGPPPPEAIHGIATLFKVTKQEMCDMIAADWYGVTPPPEVSQRVRRLETAVDALKEADFNMVEALVRRLAFGDADQVEEAA
jgi:hypothetical protein